jgi:hypothetical protein
MILLYAEYHPIERGRTSRGPRIDDNLPGLSIGKSTARDSHRSFFPLFGGLKKLQCANTSVSDRSILTHRRRELRHFTKLARQQYLRQQT